MRKPLFDPKAGKQTVSVTLHADLYAKAESWGINSSRVAEDALAQEYAQRWAEVLIAENRQALVAVQAYEEQHGACAEFVREQYERPDGAV
jgi:post-segregation antitoxin (ccd killing protein)